MWPVASFMHQALSRFRVIADEKLVSISLLAEELLRGFRGSEEKLASEYATVLRLQRYGIFGMHVVFFRV